MPVSPETKEFVTKISTEMMPYLNEKQKRIFVGIIANAIGYGGIETVKDMTGKSRTTIAAGASEVKAAATVSDATKKTDSVKPNGAPRLRKPGGGRKSAVSKNPDLPKWIEEIIDNSTYGVPTKVLRWTTMSLRKIAEQVNTDHNVKISQNIVSDVLDQLGYSKQQNQKSLQLGEQHPDRNAQFEFINNKSESFLNENQPVISVDTKKKELVGNFKNNGQEYRKSKDPRKVLDHDFTIEGLGKVAPYGIYVVNDNTGFVNLGTDHDTAEFASESILRWWEAVGKNTFPDAKKLYITADSGGSNGVRVRLWKYELQQIADYTGLELHISHYPSGTSKWNKVEHRLFCYISKNWQGKPLIDIETIVSLISSTTTNKGLKVICKVDENHYELKRKVSDEEMNSICLERCEPLGYWNYIIRPHKS